AAKTATTKATAAKATSVKATTAAKPTARGRRIYRQNSKRGYRQQGNHRFTQHHCTSITACQYRRGLRQPSQAPATI
ncbi:hypothetical protein, partial [Bradyrhizobium sp. Leo121]|uniref:hypothetical protein n=1 Tax=Bradyrhizobium sp. Leo121 TaxID=1571195 RepID=UPI0010D220DD